VAGTNYEYVIKVKIHAADVKDDGSDQHAEVKLRHFVGLGLSWPKDAQPPSLTGFRIMHDGSDGGMVTQILTPIPYTEVMATPIITEEIHKEIHREDIHCEELVVTVEEIHA
jgi:hypothetical protein